MTTPASIASFCAGVELTSDNWNSGPGTFSDMVGICDDWLLEGASSPTHVGSGSEQGMSFDGVDDKITCPNVPWLGRGTIVAVVDSNHDGSPTYNTIVGPDITVPGGSPVTWWFALTASSVNFYPSSINPTETSTWGTDKSAGKCVVAAGWDGLTGWAACNDSGANTTVATGNGINLTNIMLTQYSIGAYKDDRWFDDDIYSVYFFADCLRDSGELDDLMSALMTRYGIS